METSENHERFDDTTTPVHTDFEKMIAFSENHELIQADSELPMVVAEIQGYSDGKMVRCKNIIVSHKKSINLYLNLVALNEHLQPNRWLHNVTNRIFCF